MFVEIIRYATVLIVGVYIGRVFADRKWRKNAEDSYPIFSGIDYYKVTKKEGK